ncbi:MAG: hypothetical protein R6V85_01175 [Polyangia bacterium]
MSTTPNGRHCERKLSSLLLPALLPAAVCLALYLPSLGHPFQWDDRELLERSASFANPSRLSEALTGHYLSLAENRPIDTPYYRPLSQLVLMLERMLFGPEPIGFRAVHSGLHLLCSLLLLAGIAALLSSDDEPNVRWRAALGAALFAALPYAADSVLLLTDLGDLLALAFSLASLVAFTRFCNRGGIAAALGIAVASLAAVSSKETALLLPLLLAAFHLLLRKRTSRRRAWIGIGISLLATGVYLAARFAVLESNGSGLDPARALALLPVHLLEALRWAIAPHPLALVEPVQAEIGEIRWWIGSLLLAALIGAAWVLRKREPAVAFGLVAWLLTVAPALAVMEKTGSLSPRYLYVPGAALVLTLAAATARFRKVGIAALAGLVIAAGLLSAIRISAWSDPISLWSLETERHPEPAANRIHLGNALDDEGRPEEALEQMIAAVRLAKRGAKAETLALAHENLARLLARSPRRTDAALDQYRAAAEAFPGRPGPWLGAGKIHARDGAWRRARDSFAKAVELAPRHLESALLYAGALAATGDIEGALENLDRARALAAGSPARLAEVRAKRAAVLDLAARDGGNSGPAE